MLESTIRDLLTGSHDLALDGKSQEDMETLLQDFCKDPATVAKMRAHDSTDTLKLFWDEQVGDMLGLAC